MKRDISLSRRNFLRSLVTAAAATVIAQPVIETVAKVFTPPVDTGWHTTRTLNFHPDVFHSVMKPMNGLFNPSREVIEAYGIGPLGDPEKLGIRFMREYEVQSDQFPARFDVLYGMAVLNPKLIARISSE